MEHAVPASVEEVMTVNPETTLDPNTAEYVLPAPPRAAGEVVVVAPRVDLGRAWRRGGEVARAIGDRFLTLAESHGLFTAELRTRLLALDSTIPDATRAQLKGALRDALSVLDWADAAHADMLRESRLAAGGAEPIDIADLCQEVAAQVQTADQPVFVRGQANSSWWGPAAGLAAVIEQALAVVSERTLGVGPRAIDIDETSAGVRIWVHGVGEPGDAIEATTVARFRRSVEALGALVVPDALGAASAGFVVELPGRADRDG